MANAEYPKQVSYQSVCPSRFFGGCAIRIVEVDEGVCEDIVERPADCQGATCNPDQSIQTCGKKASPEIEVRSICPTLLMGNCAVATTVVENGRSIEVEKLPRPGCRGAIPPAEIPLDGLGRQRSPRIHEYTCGVEAQDTRPDLKLV